MAGERRLIYIYIMARRIYIYGLSDPRVGNIRYVGKSVSPVGRLRTHIARSNRVRLRKDRWIQSLLRAGVSPALTILEETTSAEWEEAERRWIRQLRACGCDLVNHTDGGDGTHCLDEEARRRISVSMIQLHQDPEFHEKMVSVWRDPDRRLKISRALTGVPKSEEHRGKIAALPQNQVGRKLSEEHRAKIKANANLRRWTDQRRKDFSSKMLGNTYGTGNKSRTGQKQDEEERRKKSEKLRGRKFSEEHKEKIKQGQLRAWERRKNSPDFNEEVLSEQMKKVRRGGSV